MRRLFLSLFATASALLAAPSQPVSPALISVDELKPGQQGEVWTVFKGTEPEPFTVEVTGIVRNAVGPGKSLILCQLTDPRVQNMGAVAGMSGSPLYVDGKLAGALSYQIQRFETVRYAGFTPAADLAEVGSKVDKSGNSAPAATAPLTSANSTFSPLRPVFTLSGLSPAVADVMASQFTALGLSVSALGGSSAGTADATKTPPALHPGSAVSVALSTGDITLAGTGTVSSVDGNKIVAFGHPMLSLGEVDLPMCSADIVTILPSTMSSIKVANTGPMIGTISQDRLSAISGTVGPTPAMIPVEIDVTSPGRPPRALKFNVARQQQLTPAIISAGLMQAIVGSNDAGLTNGFRLVSDVRFSSTQSLATNTLYAGPQAFSQGLGEFTQGLAQDLQNPYEKTFPQRVTFNIEALNENPSVTVSLFQLSRTAARSGDVVQATLAWRDFQGDSHREVIDIPVDSSWIGRQIEVVLAPGRALDELTGRPRSVSASQLRSFDAYLDAMRDTRPTDGLCLAVVERSALFTDQTVSTPDAPGSIERIARTADEARFQKHDALLPLWEKHILDGKVTQATVRRPLRVVE